MPENASPTPYEEDGSGRYGYAIADDGYDIYLDGQLWITQHGQYGKPMDASKGYEENCLLQLAEITAPAPEPPMTTEEMAQTIAEQDAAICELYEMLEAKEAN